MNARIWQDETKSAHTLHLLFTADHNEQVCHLQSAADTIRDWLAACLKQLETHPDQIARLLSCVRGLTSVLRDDGFDLQNKETFFNFLHALYAFVGHPLTLRDRPVGNEALHARAEIGGVLDDLFAAACIKHGEDAQVSLALILDGDVHYRRPVRVPDIEQRFKVIWLHVLWGLHEHQMLSLKLLLDRFEFLRLANDRCCDPVRRRSFFALCQAMAEILQKSDELEAYWRLLPIMCEQVLISEFATPEEAKSYLEPILSSDGDNTEERLFRIIDVVRESGGQPARRAYMEALVELMGDHYLKFYDLDEVVLLWERTGLVRLSGRKETAPGAGMNPDIARLPVDRLLSFLLRLYSRPQNTLLPILGVFAVATVLAHLHLHAYEWARGLRPFLPGLVLALVIFLIGSLLVGLVYVVARSAVDSHFYYTQLLLPRLWGAIIVGLAALLTNDQPWRIVLYSRPLNLLMLGLVIYLPAFIYFLIDVYQATKLRPLRQRDRSTMYRAFRLATKVFAIGWLEAFLAVLFASTLLFTATDLPLPTNSSALGWVVCQHGRAAAGCPGFLDFAFFPTLILLWSGMALFVGAFLQLLWQGHHMTEPV